MFIYFIIYYFNDNCQLRHVGPAVVPQFETCGQRVYPKVENLEFLPVVYI